jgi:hypothetical protein
LRLLLVIRTEKRSIPPVKKAVGERLNSVNKKTHEENMRKIVVKKYMNRGLRQTAVTVMPVFVRLAFPYKDRLNPSLTYGFLYVRLNFCFLGLQSNTTPSKWLQAIPV